MDLNIQQQNLENVAVSSRTGEVLRSSLHQNRPKTLWTNPEVWNVLGQSVGKDLGTPLEECKSIETHRKLHGIMNLTSCYDSGTGVELDVGTESVDLDSLSTAPLSISSLTSLGDLPST